MAGRGADGVTVADILRYRLILQFRPGLRALRGLTGKVGT